MYSRLIPIRCLPPCDQSRLQTLGEGVAFPVRIPRTSAKTKMEGDPRRPLLAQEELLSKTVLIKRENERTRHREVV
jgi:hypothetical protein